MIAKECCITKGAGVSKDYLPSFDKALLEAGVGNYNLVRLSSILPAGCKWIDVRNISEHIKEGSLLPVAYSTITSDVEGETIVSVIGVGLPKDKSKVGVIMEYSYKGFSARKYIAMNVLENMIHEAFEARDWELDSIISNGIEVTVGAGEVCTTFACIAEW